MKICKKLLIGVSIASFLPSWGVTASDGRSALNMSKEDRERLKRENEIEFSLQRILQRAGIDKSKGRVYGGGTADIVKRALVGVMIVSILSNGATSLKLLILDDDAEKAWGHVRVTLGVSLGWILLELVWPKFGTWLKRRENKVYGLPEDYGKTLSIVQKIVKNVVDEVGDLARKAKDRVAEGSATTDIERVLAELNGGGSVHTEEASSSTASTLEERGTREALYVSRRKIRDSSTRMAMLILENMGNRRVRKVRALMEKGYPLAAAVASASESSVEDDADRRVTNFVILGGQMVAAIGWESFKIGETEIPGSGILEIMRGKEKIGDIGREDFSNIMKMLEKLSSTTGRELTKLLSKGAAGFTGGMYS